MKKIAGTFVILLGMMLISTMALAAGGSSPLLPGGAALGLWRCDGGASTEISVENVQSYAVLVHLVFLDPCSQEIMNFTVPLGPQDLWTGHLTCTGQRVRVDGSHAALFDPPNNGSEPHEAPSSATYGYLSVAITAIDSSANINRPGNTPVRACDGQSAGAPPRNCNDGDPRNDFNWTGQTVLLPNAIVLRLVTVRGGDALALPAIQIQDFINAAGLPVGDDLLGIVVNHEELLASNRAATVIPGYFAVGSTTGIYWANYVSGGTLALVFPADGLDCANDEHVELALNIFDDNQNRTSARAESDEVTFLRMGTDVTAYPRGKARLEVTTRHQIPATPRFPLAMFGYSLLENQPDSVATEIVPERKAVCDAAGCLEVGVMHQAGTVY